MSVNIHFLPLRQGANEVFREMTKCHFVPHEGSTTQCDAGPTQRGRGGLGAVCGECFLIHPLRNFVPRRPCLRGTKWVSALIVLSDSVFH